MPKPAALPLSFQEYERLFRAIHAVVASEDSEPAKACLFFGLAGAHILRTHHKLEAARPVAGFAGYNLRLPTNLALLLGAHDGDHPSSNAEAFHCWIEVEGYVVDLTAPLFDELAPVERKGHRVPPLMFQKAVGTGVSELTGINTPGAHIHIENRSLMDDLAKHFGRLRANEDLVNICSQWYMRPPKKMSPHVDIGNQHGEVKQVRLSPIQLEGKW